MSISFKEFSFSEIIKCSFEFSFMDSDNEDVNISYNRRRSDRHQGIQADDDDESQDDDHHVNRRISYADSSVASTNSDELDKCLEEAINDADEDDEDDEADDNNYGQNNKVHFGICWIGNKFNNEPFNLLMLSSIVGLSKRNNFLKQFQLRAQTINTSTRDHLRRRAIEQPRCRTIPKPDQIPVYSESN